ncbi:MAG: hypothetical protein JRF48_11190 [Deltaproteobacteria bacterium]|nr:hypothetical protein [Deltaproteobacteria bacterium]
MHRLLLVAIVVGFILGGSGFAPSSARAYHTYEERLLDSTAYSLQRRRVRLGLFKLSYGIIDQLQVTTYTMPWLLGLIFEDVAPNIELKSTFYNRKRLALSASLGFLSGTIEQVEGVESTKVRYFLTPASLAASVRINSDVSTHIGGIFTGVSGDVDTSPGANDIAGSTVVDILQFWGMVEWRGELGQREPGHRHWAHGRVDRLDQHVRRHPWLRILVETREHPARSGLRGFLRPGLRARRPPGCAERRLPRVRRFRAVLGATGGVC